jgi:cytidyltransferase-like protein
MDTVVIYPGRFHPFHKGHKSVYDALVKRFGKNRVYIATSNKVDPPKSPFTFDEKRAMMALTGVDPSRVVQVKNPYQATEITDNYDPQNTIALFAVSDKDMAEDPRFSFKPRKDGQPSYYQPASKDMQGFDKHGYIVTVPTLQFNVLGKPMRSASEFRANFAQADSETQRAMITDLFGQYDPKTHNTMAQKIVEQLIRADEILDKLIEMGADDCYILEACIRVESLVESINMKQRKQTLYQAIMEGGHSLPENIVSTPANQFGAMRKTDTLADKTVMSKSAQTYTKQAQRKQAAQDARQGAQQSTIVKTPNQPKINFGEEITDFNTEDPMNSVIAIRGIGTMSISSALEKVSEMAMDIAKLGAMKDAKNVQDNLPRYMDLLATYNESIQEAYRELAQQRKRGGTASRGIDKDISESDNLSTDNVDPRFKNLIKTAIIKYPFAKNAMDAVLHMMSDKLKTDAAQSADIKRLDKENDAQDTEIDDLEKQIAKEHCGDPMAHEHKPGRMLLMKLYKKEMQCQPGSPEHFEVMKMIDGCRKNIGLEEGMWDTVTKTVGKAAQAVGKTVQGAVDNRTATLTGGKKKSASSFRPS